MQQERDNNEKKQVGNEKKQSADGNKQGGDYLQCLKFSFFRRDRKGLLFSSTKNIWIDPELEKALSKLESIHVTLITFLVGFLVVAFGAMQLGDYDTVLWAIVIWALADIFIVNPIVYMRACPRPIKAHIKHISDMSEEERVAYEEAANKDEKLEKLMKKYRPTEEQMRDKGKI